jgi:hypothetical protein
MLLHAPAMLRVLLQSALQTVHEANQLQRKQKVLVVMPQSLCSARSAVI